MTWRTGRKVGRTIYQQLGSMPSDADPLIGVMDTPELARLASAAPDLLASLKEVLDDLEGFGWGVNRTIADRAHQAIRKAASEPS